MSLELDHVFVFVDESEAMPGGGLRARLDALGLVPSYERRHKGQGTANLCWCFDDAYLELLFVVDEAELRSPAVARNGFVDRSAGTAGASPVGIALRGGALGVPSWPYRIAGFPPGMTIPVAEASDDVRLPFVFGSPGTARPDRWTDGRAGGRQSAAGFGEIAGVEILQPSDTIGHPVFEMLRDVPKLTVGEGGRPGLRLHLAAVDGGNVTIDLA